VANEARPAAIRHALCNCIGFGSKNSALVVKKFEV
jgi:3-oxoacyl-(acyl-carrier-protein) synthase